MTRRIAATSPSAGRSRRRLPRKRVGATLFTVAAAVLALASVAWACTGHFGNIWFCTISNCSSPGQSSFTQGSFYVQGNILLSNTTYVIHYAPLGSGGGMAGPCMAGPLLRAPGAATPLQITTNATGKMPSRLAGTPPGGGVVGITYESCAQPISASAPNQFSNHTVFTVT